MSTSPPAPLLEGNSTASPTANSEFYRSSWIIAVVLAVFAALLNNLGVNLQKLAWTKKQSSVIRGSVYRTYWLVGMISIVLASVFDFVALGFGPQSVIAPIGALTMVANAFIAPWMHGETLHPGVLKATAIIIIGCATAVGAASHDNHIHDIDSLFGLYLTGRFAIYILIVLTLVLGTMLFIKRAERLKAELGEDSEEYQKVFRLHRLSYAALSGVFGAQSVLFARAIDQLFVGSLKHDGFFLEYFGTYVILFCLVACIVLQLYWLNQGLARFESLYNVPIFTSTWIVGTALGGGVFYGEFADFSWAQALLFPLGVFLCCLGVFFLAQGTEADVQTEGITHEEDDESEPKGLRAEVDEDGVNGEDSRRVDLLGLPQKGSRKPLVFS